MSHLLVTHLPDKLTQCCHNPRMINQSQKILGLIPARGGSKSIPEKNIALLNGVPLIGYTIQAAKAAQLSHVIVSTDSQNIADSASQLGAEVPFVRPAELAQDNSGAVGVIEHAIDFFQGEQTEFDFIVYLQPTSPLRTTEDIDQAVGTIRHSDADSLVSIMDVPHQFTPGSLMLEAIDDGKNWVSHANEEQQPLTRQEKKQYVARNGPAILITRPKTIKKYGNLYGEKILSYKMPRSRSVDIDEQADLEYAEWLIQQNKTL